MKYEIPNDTIDCACITFKLKNELVDGVPTETNHNINIAHSDIKMLLKEMKTVRSLMDETEQNAMDQEIESINAEIISELAPNVIPNSM